MTFAVRLLLLVGISCLPAARSPSGSAGGPATSKMPAIDADVLIAIETELARLDEKANSETGPQVPPPSKQVAYYLLAGLAGQGVLLTELREDERRQFDIEKRGGRTAKLVSVCADVRVALIGNAVQDTAGTYVHTTAVLYLYREGQWSKKGNGEAIGDPDQPSP